MALIAEIGLRRRPPDSTRRCFPRQIFLTLLLLGIFSLDAARNANCSTQTAEQELTSSVLSYRFHSAPMAPAYLSEYEVAVHPNLSVRLWYRYGPGNSADGVTRDFQIGDGQYRTLIRILAKAGVLGDRWTPGETPVGADQESFSVLEPSGKTVTITSVLQQEPMTRFLIVANAMRATVPRSAWLEKDRGGQAYQRKLQSIPPK